MPHRSLPAVGPAIIPLLWPQAPVPVRVRAHTQTHSLTHNSLYELMDPSGGRRADQTALERAPLQNTKDEGLTRRWTRFIFSLNLHQLPT